MDALTDGFKGQITRPAVPFRYRAALVAVVLVMVALPVLYVAIAVVAAWGVLKLDLMLLGSGLTGRALLFSLAAVTFGGGVAVFFMFKPLFAPRPPQPDAYVVQPDQEPRLFGLVTHLCSVVGAPPPSTIALDCEVNASASFRRGIRSFVGSELTLTIGMPLAAGLTLRQLTGVLAHEFGHFSQGGGMRLTYVIRSVNHWFARVVYERDAWDAALERTARRGTWLSVIAQIAQGATWVTRRILQGLMWCGHATSCLALRQMEFDADGCATQVVGSATFESTSARLRELGLANAGAHHQLRETFSDQRLVDDLPALIMTRLRACPPDVLAGLHANAMDVRTRAMDTHPSDADRVASARASDAPGIFAVDAPASVLFRDFEDVCREVTSRHYRRVVGDRLASNVAIEPIEHYLAGEQVEGDALNALQHVCGNVLPSRLHALGPLEFDAQADVPAAVEGLRHHVNAMRGETQRVRAAFERLAALEFRSLETQAELAVAEVRGRGDRRTLNTMRELDDAERASAQVGAEIADEAARVDRYLALAGARMNAGLLVSASRPGAVAPPGSRDVSDARRLVAAYNALRASRPEVEHLRRSRARLHGLLRPIVEDAQNNQDLVPAILAAARDISGRLQRLQDTLREAPFPFSGPGSGRPLSVSIVETVPPPDDLGQAVGVSGEVIERADRTHVRLVAHLCRVVRDVELAVLADADRSNPC